MGIDTCVGEYPGLDSCFFKKNPREVPNHIAVFQPFTEANLRICKILSMAFATFSGFRFQFHLKRRDISKTFRISFPFSSHSIIYCNADEIICFHFSSFPTSSRLPVGYILAYPRVSYVSRSFGSNIFPADISW